MRPLYFKHLTIFVSILFFFSLILSQLLPKNLIAIGGEYIFSFDYVTHVSNILTDFRNSGIYENNTLCNDCPDFYHYSRWYSLFKISFQAIGEVLSIHPFIFLVFSSISIQMVSMYVLTKTLIGKVHQVPFIIASLFIICSPYKYSLLIETHDGTLYGTTILLFSLLLLVYRHISDVVPRKYILLSISFALLFSTYFNINIAFFPIVFYMSVIVSIFHVRKFLKQIKRYFALILLTVVVSFVLNFPFFYSLLKYGVDRHYADYFSFTAIDSLFLGIKYSGASTYITIAFGFLTLLALIFSGLPKKLKMYLTITYLFVFLLLLGKNSIVDFYGYFFNHLPLFDSLRSTYRLFVIQFSIMYLFMYGFIKRIYSKKMLLQFIAFSMLIVPLIHIVTHRNYFFFGYLPPEYFETQRYLNQKTGGSIYLPLAKYGIKSISNNYDWSDLEYSNSIVIYKNPFTSLVPITHHLQFEKFPLLSPERLELFTALNQYTPLEKVNALSQAGISYVIVDGNYHWEPELKESVEKFTSHLLHVKTFGSIDIYVLPPKHTSCMSYYGDFLPNGCFSAQDPKVLVNRSKFEFVVETKLNEYEHKNMMINRKKRYYNNVLDPIDQSFFLNRGLLVSNKPFQIQADQQSVFTTNHLHSGEYYLLIPVLHLNNNYSSNGSFLSLSTPSKTLLLENRMSICPGVYWHVMRFTINSNESNVYLNVGSGFNHLLLNQSPVIVSGRVYNQIVANANNIAIDVVNKCR